MSRVGNKAVQVPQGVNVSVDGPRVVVKGPKGEMAWTLPETISASVEKNEISFKRSADTRLSRSLHGLSRNLVNNMVVGVVQGYSKELVVEGVGFKVELQGGKLVLALGYSSPVQYQPPQGIKLAVAGNVITISGVDKALVGDAAAHIKTFYPPEPYKGKGIRYKGEHVRRKVGKTVQ